MTDIIQIILLVCIAWFIVTGQRGFQDMFSKRRKVILDSCALIDGRVVEIVTSGFVVDELVIPQFILSELQLLADGNDSHKRERARFGLDIAHQLQDASPTPVTIDRNVLTEVSATDDKLILLAKKLRAALYTTDYNLAKVAAVEGIKVLNVNELAQNLRPITLPGETLTIKILQKGSNRDQGVGYLEDGTMIVVDGAARHIGKTMPVTVTRMHQTVAGKMVFGQVAHEEKPRKSAASTVNPARTSPAVPIDPSKKSPTAKQEQAPPASPQGKLHSRLHKTFRRKRIVI